MPVQKSTKKQSIKKEVTKKVTRTPKKKDYGALALALHKKLHGKLEVHSKVALANRDAWSTAYTPGVGAVSSHLAKYPKDARQYTIKLVEAARNEAQKLVADHADLSRAFPLIAHKVAHLGATLHME